MNTKNVIKALSAYSIKASDIERMIVYAFIKQEKIGYDNSAVLKDFVSELDDNLCNKAIEFFNTADIILSLDLIVELFEQIVPEGEKKKKG